MRDLASEIAKEYPDIQLSSFVGNLDHALDFARTYPGQYFDVIFVTRRNHAHPGRTYLPASD